MKKNNWSWIMLKVAYLLAETVQMIIVTIILGYFVSKLGNSIKFSQIFLILENCWHWIVFYFGVGLFKILMDYCLRILER